MLCHIDEVETGCIVDIIVLRLGDYYTWLVLTKLTFKGNMPNMLIIKLNAKGHTRETKMESGKRLLQGIK